MFQPCLDMHKAICSLCKAKTDQEALDTERKLISDTVTNKNDLVIESLTTKHHWKLELLMAPKGKLLKAYALLKRPLNFQHKAPTESEAVALSLMQSRQDQMALLSLVSHATGAQVDSQFSLEEHNQKSLDALQSKNASHVELANPAPRFVAS